ncbi:MAG: methylated-DNA--[protein]-cysteine S-methyltransferase [Hyphomicrobiales bacterium]|nr:methylated-DNA--[protein]-cysteine S-methyltransferase [Hyphomicrobiales bacterium]
MAHETFYHLFDTSLGPVGMAWTGEGLARLQLPEADRPRTYRRLKARRSTTWVRTWIRASPSSMVLQAIREIKRHIGGEPPDYASVPLDLTDVSLFDRKIYEAAREIQWGRTTSYGELAELAGYPGEARETGQALGRNPIAIIIPCHRILARGKRIGGFSAHGGRLTKERLLALEGVDLEGDAPLLPGLLPRAW